MSETPSVVPGQVGPSVEHQLRLYLDRFEAKSNQAPLNGVIARALYVVEGSLALRAPGSEATHCTLGANAAAAAALPVALAGGSLPATVLRWELVERAAADARLEPWAESSTRLLAADVKIDSALRYLLRCDRVDFPPGGEALTHTHQGGGIRCLLFGSIRIETQGATHRYVPFGAWFEAGPEPVYAAADPTQPSAFARVMILPQQLLGGKSSIKYVKPEDQNRPKSQRYQIFLDQPVELPR